LSGLINTTLNSKKFSLSGYDVDSMIKSFDDWVIMDVDMDNQSSHLIFDACI